MNEGESSSRAAKKEMIEANLRLVIRPAYPPESPDALRYKAQRNRSHPTPLMRS
jgi:hypothetical protein